MSHYHTDLPMLGAGYTSTVASSQSLNCLENGIAGKQKRRPPGTPDPDAEVIYLSPETLMESDHYICEICNQGFQREQNLQMHRRRHNVPWKLLKRDAIDHQVRKRVYVCPDPTCLHNNPNHALGDLVGIKKHFRRKHSNHKQWVCEKCSKGYAVQSDYKSHLKTCGTRGHSCDCGRVFSRVETFIKHQDTCKGRTIHQQPRPHYLLQTCLSPITTNSKMPMQNQTDLVSLGHEDHSKTSLYHQFNLQNNSLLKLSLGSVNHGAKSKSSSSSLKRLEEEAREQLRVAMEEKGLAEEKRRQAKWQIELAKQDFSNAKRIREQALMELHKAQVMKECAMKKINSNLLHITCNACKREFQEIRE